MQLLVTMAIPRPDITEVSGVAEGYLFERARIEVLDWDRKTCLASTEYRPPNEHLPEGLSVRFTGGCPYRGAWYQTTSTEIIVYDPRDWSLERVISHPTFHDLHGLVVTDEELVVVNTGLDMIQFLNHDGEIVREVNVAPTPTWSRFDRGTDYRQVLSTKPHEIHPNHVFQIDGEWWVTRCLKADAVNLERPSERIDIAVGQPHDGIVRGDYIYFTTTNAHLVIVDRTTRKVEDTIDLARLDRNTRGWCRGLEIDDDHAYVGFTRVRMSKWAGTFNTMKDALKGRKRNTHIEKIDLAQRRLVDSYDYETFGSGAVFTLMDYRRVLGQIP